MKDHKPPRRYYVLIIAIAFLTLVAGVVLYDGVNWGIWYNLVVLGSLLVYLHTVSVTLGDTLSYSLSTATIFPIIYLFGAIPAMLMSGLGGLLDGILNKKSWERILFNVSQLALSALAASLVFTKIAGSFDSLSLRGVLGMGLGALAYITCNIILVSCLIATWLDVSWWNQLSKLLSSALNSSIGTAFIGLIFTLFVVSYGFWGLVTFSMLLIYLSELLKAAVAVSGERQKRRKLEEELLIDDMTQIYNFRFLNKWLDDPTEKKMAILFLDIDDFKLFNDRYGHAEGNKVLKQVCQTISESVRSNDNVVRYGGEEFVVLLPEMNEEGAQRVAERIQANLSKLSYSTWEQPITVSIGVASGSGDKRQLLLQSDQAMYFAKQSGKNTIRVWAQRDPA